MELLRTDLYKEFLAERQEILCHKWIESEKVGYDIGFERALALLDWTLKHRLAWRQSRTVLSSETVSIQRRSGVPSGLA
jgi:hypothetical protein